MILLMLNTLTELVWCDLFKAFFSGLKEAQSDANLFKLFVTKYNTS